MPYAYADSLLTPIVGSTYLIYFITFLNENLRLVDCICSIYKILENFSKLLNVLQKFN